VVRLQLPPHELLLDFLTALVALTSLAFWTIADRYLLSLLPYTLIVLGRECKPLLRQYGRLVAVFCVLIAVASAVETRRYLALNEALWKGGEIARSLAAPHQNVSSSWEWVSNYYFPVFLARNQANRTVYDFEDWLDDFYEASEYTLELDPPENPSRTVLATVPYRPFPFVERRVYILKKSAGSQLPKTQNLTDPGLPDDSSKRPSGLPAISTLGNRQ